ncbi:GntR family transcriptional regulator [Brucella tritici]|uniref:GntR family transcriptional regulator n=1 Tax=Brucella tritici TaxID=94626 RepID=UPI002001B341|nr:GntR family transcriptional regulator [Brucella tritici]
MTSDLGHIEAATIKTQVYQRLREALFMGMFSPGESLTIRNLATSLGTSPMPVREALQRLVAEHALTQMPNRTFRVTPFTSEMFRELVRIRMATEGLAASQAARRMTTETLDQLRSLNDQMIRGIQQQDPAKVMTANREFHFALYRQAEMLQLMGIINGLWLRAGPYLANAHRKLADPLPFFRAGTLFHERIIAACRAGDHHAAARAIACDIWHSARYFRPNVTLINEPASTAISTRRQRGKTMTGKE